MCPAGGSSALRAPAPCSQLHCTQTPSHPPARVQGWFAKGSSGGSGGREGEKRKCGEVLVPSSKEAERGLVQVVFQLEESPRTRVWMKPGFFLPKKEYKMEMEVNVNKSG